MNDIVTHTVELRDGHSIQFFVNTATHLVVVDYLHKNGRGGNELLRRTLNAKTDLAHC